MVGAETVKKPCLELRCQIYLGHQNQDLRGGVLRQALRGDLQVNLCFTAAGRAEQQNRFVGTRDTCECLALFGAGFGGVLAVRAIVAADPLVCVIARMCAWVVRA